jgi:hypothetical protein
MGSIFLMEFSNELQYHLRGKVGDRLVVVCQLRPICMVRFTSPNLLNVMCVMSKSTLIAVVLYCHKFSMSCNMLPLMVHILEPISVLPSKLVLLASHTPQLWPLILVFQPVLNVFWWRFIEKGSHPNNHQHLFLILTLKMECLINLNN